MGWIQSHDTIWEHHKLSRFCVLTGVCKAQAVGHLHGLWHFVLRNAWRDANLEPWGDAEIERAMFWEGEKGRGVEALRKAGFLDGFVVHDWVKTASGLVSERLYNEKRRKNGVKTAQKRRETPAYKRERESRVDKKENNYSQEEIDIAEKLKAYILQNNPGARVPSDLSAWQLDARRMMRIDARSKDDILKVMDFSQKDDFWKSNILSIGKLREHFDKLYLKVSISPQSPKPLTGQAYIDGSEAKNKKILQGLQ